MTIWTSGEAATALRLGKSTTRRAAANGDVIGAYLDTERKGVINPPYVATEEAWRAWYATRRKAGRPKGAKQAKEGGK